MGKIIGIDLGTTNSCVAVLEGGEPVIITNSEGSRTTPSVVAFTKEGERLVGQIAKRQAVVNSDRTIMSIKTEMGTNFSVKIDDKKYSPQEISAMILTKLKNDAEAYIGEKITEAVITVPAYFSDTQRQATKDAGKIAGLEVLRIINEPTAASLAYGLDKSDKKNQKVLIYDLGGGTFDVSILEISDGVFEVLATNGNTRLGGDDFDAKIMEHLVAEFKKSDGIDLTKDKMAMQRLKEASEKAKIELSSTTSTNINLPFITADSSGPKHLDLTLTRQKFDALTANLVKGTMGPTTQAMKDAGVTANDIHRVILVGGSTRIPAVQDAVKSLTGKDPYKGINPDECVAAGAAIQAGVLGGEVKNVLLLDVTPLSLGIETLGGICTRLIPRNTTIPTSKSQVFSTAVDNQAAVDIHVLQGEREMAADNKTLGAFSLMGIPPARRGIPQIEVKFDIDANGIVHVTATDLGTKKVQSVTLTSTTNLSETDIDKAIKDAEKYADEDRKRKEGTEIKNGLDQLIFTIESFMNENKDKVSAEDRSSLEAGISDAKKVMAGGSIDEIKKITNDLTTLSTNIFQKLYEKNEAEVEMGAEKAAESSGKNVQTEEVVDFTVEDNKKQK